MYRQICVGFAVILIAVFGAAHANDVYPSRTIRLVVPWPPGSGGDIAGRLIALRLGQKLGQTIFIDNRPGASGTIGSTLVARDMPDGYTLLLGNSASHGSAKALFPGLQYDPVKDFTPISYLYKNRLVLIANSATPFNTVPEMIAYAKANPEKLTYGTPGDGTPHMLAVESLKTAANVQITHIPYKGGGQAMTDLHAGHIQLAVTSLSTAVDLKGSGGFKILASVDTQPIAAMKDLPSLARFYPGIDVSGWGALFGPPGLPPEIVAKLSSALKATLSEADLREKMNAAGLEPSVSSPQELTERVKAEVTRWDIIFKKSSTK